MSDTALDHYLVAETARGSRVLSQSDTWAVIARGRPVNHVLQLLLTIFTCGWWGLAWLLMVALGGERRVTVTSTPHGVVEQKQPLEFQRIAAMVGAGIWGVFMLIFLFSMASACSHIGDTHSTPTTTSTTSPY